ncbi:FAD-binding and (Fe-S)-binding domain-containing protein [Acidipropionibacterium acidipropionici]|jgi:D-lactate dehydrogenase|uniref:FAD-binding and (Fe-S)-binding domain-containing protein n=1 Tax=Acidipropionibacterium acidipropionici TaxID=1748 RepID=UPI0003F64DC0|nr:FAD-binding and (Fe-S)-binding domain-containing protein [Acidipropionibacterium acidipropionici]ALN16306.1 oxidoreductase [Acidipropionibacterium acidipropionici]QCV95345.1 FAD-binding oxidoreductase [Acidipropionibacterium acidipropionici]
MLRSDQSTIPEALVAELRQSLGEPSVTQDTLDLAAASVDASHYLLTPGALVRARSVSDVAAAMAAAKRHRVSLNFRSGGTSLSGQGLTRGLMVDTRRAFRGIQVLDAGKRVRVQPGATVQAVNAVLARLGRKLGPDPASSKACTLGGVIADNSSGMSCGTVANTYKTLESMVIVLTSGTVVDTGDPDCEDKLAAAEPQLVESLLALRDQCRREDLAAEIRHQFSMKNTMGYGINSFLDHDTPAQILQHLMIGSEGTLGFIASAVLKTLPIMPQISTALLHFPTLDDAAKALPDLVASGVTVTELMDSASLELGRNDPRDGHVIPPSPGGSDAALLVEYHCPDADSRREAEERGNAVISGLDLVNKPVFTDDPAVRGPIWNIRDGLYAKVAGTRPSGQTALLEDIAVPVESLAGVCSDLQGLFGEHGYPESIIFGHAKDGNIHFLVLEDFRDTKGLDRYETFTADMVDLVLGSHGTLKAEHGTGRIMAPFVEKQYGPELYGVMTKVKQTLDPDGMLNEGTIITDDDKLHLKDIKLTPTVQEEVDRCVECGYCEPVCPSRDLTLTPRQRIVVQRAIAQAEADGDEKLAAELREKQEYKVIATCAVDGMCETNCPVHINTGDLVRRLRAEENPEVWQLGWDAVGKAWSPFVTVASGAMSAIRPIPAKATNVVTGAARAVLGKDRIPMVSDDLPGGGKRRVPGHRNGPAGRPEVVYMPACVNTMFGSAVPQEETMQFAVIELLTAAGIGVTVPEGINSICCGTPWKSKGMTKGYANMRRRVVDIMRDATRDGELVVLSDAVSCSEGFVHELEYEGVTNIRVVDAVQYIADELLPVLPPLPKVHSAALHPTCSSTRMGWNDAIRRCAEAIADEVVIADAWGCCGFAGDRGMLHPELTASATAREAAELQRRHFDLYLSANRTCEIGMQRATGKPWRHVLNVLAERMVEFAPA